MSNYTFPTFLVDQIKEGNVILFLGSGFSYGSEHPNNAKIPIGQGLADMLAEKFLDSSYKGGSLMHNAQIAINESGIFEVQKYIYDIFSDFKPASFHKLIATFKWKAIYTTNYDFIVEEAYRASHDNLQDLSVVIKNTKDFNIFKNPQRSLPYFKLHSCLSEINDDELPLILTPDQYITHRKKREMMFNKFFSDAWNHLVLFVGFSLSDPDIMTILHQLGNEVKGRVKSYFVGPNVREAEIKFWEQKRIGAIKMSFQTFIESLDKSVPKKVRLLSGLKPILERPIYSKFAQNLNEIRPSETFVAFLENDVEYVHSLMGAEYQDPKEFYKGYFENWGPIIRNLDATRDITEGMLSEILLQEYYTNDSEGQFLFLITGHAGAGKSVLLKRIAWVISVDFDKLCIFYKRYGKIRYENIVELYNHVKQRIYLFIDNALYFEDDLIYVLRKCKKDGIPITIFSTERINAWKGENNELKFQLTNSYQLEYLSDKEIRTLLTLLERHNSLGYLENKTTEERVNILRYKPGYELLVTLYEATEGKPFAEIIKDEFDRISGDEARSLYLTVSILHRLKVAARAGLIARVHGISLSKFRTELLDPLSYIVFDRKDYRIQDYVYQTRHPYIAELLVETVLTDPKARLEEYIRVLKYLDTDFQSDRVAFASLTNAKKLLSDFPPLDYIQKIYEVALENNSDNARLLQQQAIFYSETGNLALAEKKMREAERLTDNEDPFIQHTFAELEIKKAENAKLSIEKKQYLNQAIRIAEKLTKAKNPTPHSFHTILKAVLMQIELSLLEDDAIAIERLIKQFDRKLNDSKQFFPYQDFIMTIEAQFNEMFNDRPAALELLQKAHELNPGSPFITTRLVLLLEAEKKYLEATKILDKAIKFLSGDRDINFLYAQFMIRTKPTDYTSILHYLSRSYIENDSRHYAQFLHAKTLYLAGETSRSYEKFRKLEQLEIDPDIKNGVHDVISENGINIVYKGIVKSKEYSFGFLKREKYGDEIYFYAGDRKNSGLKINEKVIFNIGFNYRGLIAVNIERFKN